MTDELQGQFTIQTRVYVNNEQREKLFVMARDHDLQLPELLTELLASFLDHLPDYAAQLDLVPADEPTPDDVAAQIQQRRAEIRRLRARAMIGGDAMPAWLHRYIKDLESEIQQLEQRR